MKKPSNNLQAYLLALVTVTLWAGWMILTCLGVLLASNILHKREKNA